MLESFTVETFAGGVGEAFRIVAGADTAIDAHLIEVRTWGDEGRRAHGRIPFALTFRGPLRPVLPQRIYQFEHHAIGTFDLFIVPIGPDAEGMRYEAIFS